MSREFTWRDGERLIRFGSGGLAAAGALLQHNGFARYVLLSTERGRASAPALAAGAASLVDVPAGKVDDISAALLGRLDRRAPLVALGGGRVVDTAKALAGATAGRCAAIPTTLSGAELTPFHRLPAGVDGARMVRPALVIADPQLMASAPLTRLAASAMNALAHAMEVLYTPLANPVCDIAALRAASLLAAGITHDPPDREALALGAVLAGYASGSTGIAVHHALCQTIVRSAGSPHAETNAVMLPHSARLMVGRAPGPMSELARALTTPYPAAEPAASGLGADDPEAAPADIARIAARCGHVRLATLGVGADHLPEIARTVQSHPALPNTPDPPGEEELLALLRDAL